MRTSRITVRVLAALALWAGFGLVAVAQPPTVEKVLEVKPRQPPSRPPATGSTPSPTPRRPARAWATSSATPTAGRSASS